MTTITNPFGLTQEALDACAREPIHMPGSIQPRGVLLILEPNDLMITQVSSNSADMIGREPSQLLGQSLAIVLPPTSVEQIRTQLSTVSLGTVISHEFTINLHAEPHLFLSLIHHHHGLVFVELLPLDDAIEEAPPLTMPEGLPSAAHADPIHNMHTLIRQFAVLTLNQALDTPLQEFCQQVANQVRILASYDRVMIYQFDDVGNGEVIAEARSNTIEPFLGLCYPATDIPPQARMLYLRNRVRVLGDVYASPSPLLPRINPVTKRDPDLSYCLLRSFSPVHLEYLHNMGVRATLTVSIIEQGRLWGLIACHHYQPHWLSHEIRAACDMLSEMISMQITLREYAFRAQATTHARIIQHDLIRRLAGNKYLFTALVDEETTLPGMLAADGVAISSDDTIVTYGITPELEDIRILVTWLQTTISAKVIVTDRLTTLSPTFASMAGTASGMVAMEIDRDQGSYVFWFRREAVQTVTWGGNPAEKLLTTNGTSRLRPRKSFEAWQTEMRGISRPWPADSHMLVEALRTVLVEVVLELMTTRHTMVSLDLLRIQRAVEASSEPIVVADPEGMVLLVNPAFTRITGYDTITLRAQGGLMTLPINATLATVIETVGHSQQGNWQGELEIRDRDGNVIPVQLRLDNVRNEAGASIGQIRLYTDLRPQRRAEEERRQLDAQLFETQKLESLGILAGGIAHDFNNLLTAMLGYANLVRLELPADSPALEGITQIELAAQRATELSRQMLAYSGREKFIVQPINLSHVVHEMAQLLQSVVTKTTILRLNLNEQIPSVMADITQIRQIVMNLITNAADAIGESGGEIILTTKVVIVDTAFFAPYTRFEQLPDGQYVLLEVADTGAGMDEQTQARVFEPFYTTKFVGRGLGLAAVQGIVRGHRGAIRVESQLGRGTTFGVLLPITTTSVKQSVREPAPVALGAGQLILVIDDDAGVRAFVQRALERAGYQTLMAIDGQAGVAVFAAHMHQISAVLLDLTMPNLSGLETFNALRQIRADAKVILCSGYSEQEATLKFVGKGLSGFVQKPFRAHDLLEVLHRIIIGPKPNAS